MGIAYMSGRGFSDEQKLQPSAMECFFPFMYLLCRGRDLLWTVISGIKEEEEGNFFLGKGEGRLAL